MAQYKTHSLFNIFLALPATVIALLYFINPPPHLLATYAGFFTYATLFMSPDMDLAHQIKFFSLRGILTAPFRLYSKFFSHRGLSHSILFGSMTRILFLMPLIVLGLWAGDQSMPTTQTVTSFFQLHSQFFLYAFIGIFLADMCHLLLDI